jgi:hypothetical protein
LFLSSSLSWPAELCVEVLEGIKRQWSRVTALFRSCSIGHTSNKRPLSLHNLTIPPHPKFNYEPWISSLNNWNTWARKLTIRRQLHEIFCR